MNTSAKLIVAVVGLTLARCASYTTPGARVAIPNLTAADSDVPNFSHDWRAWLQKRSPRRLTSTCSRRGTSSPYCQLAGALLRFLAADAQFRLGERKSL